MADGARVVVVEGLALSDTEATALSLAGAATMLALGVAVSIVSMRREARRVNGMYRQLALRLGGELVPARRTGYGHARLTRAGLSVEVSNEADWPDDERLLNDRTKITVRRPAGRPWPLPALIITASPGRREALDDPAVFARVVGCDPTLVPAAARAALLGLARVAHEVEVRPTEFVAWFTRRGLWHDRRYIRDVDALVRLVDQTVVTAAALLH